MKTLSVTTKQIVNNGKWNCNTTYNCYDHLEVDETIEGAQSKMSALLKRLGFTGELKFEEPKPYVKQPEIIGRSVNLNYRYNLPRLDTGMV